MAHHTQQIQLGRVPIGGGAPITIQSMTKSLTTRFSELSAEVRNLERAGCDIIRIAVPDAESVHNLRKILDITNVPIVADIHFDYQLALKSIDAGVHGIRINPGNIRSRTKVREIANRAREQSAVIRVGINSGSLEPDIRRKHGGVTPTGLVESALHHCREIESCGHHLLKVSIKASDLRTMVTANRQFAQRSDIPLHIGVTEAGPGKTGTVKSAIGIGTLLLEDIGDTIRVSLSAGSVEEVQAGRRILGCLGLIPGMPELISCPTCARKNFDVVTLAEEVENAIHGLIKQGYRFKISKIAVMGCAVNGPGEASEADVGIAGAQNGAVLFKNGNVVTRLEPADMQTALLDEIRRSARIPDASPSADRK